MQPGQLGAGADAELIGEPLPGVVEDPQRLRLAPGPVQGDHQQPARPLPQRVLGRQRGQLGHGCHVLALVEHEVRPLLGRGGAQLGEPVPLCLGKWPGHPGERLAAPQGERLLDRAHRAARVARRAQPARPVEALLEVIGVKATGGEAQQVAAARGNKDKSGAAPRPSGTSVGPVRLENAAQPGHVGVDAVLRAGRRLLAPHRVDKLTARDHPVGPAGEHAQYRELPWLAGSQLMTLAPDRDRPEHSDPQRRHAQRPPFAPHLTAAKPTSGYAMQPSGTATQITAPHGRASRKYPDHL